MIHSIKPNKAQSKVVYGITLLLLTVSVILSLLVGKYPLSLQGLLQNIGIQRSVFLNLRLGRTLVGLVGGFTLGLCGYVFQTVFQNPLASPDMIGVSSGASVGAAFGIVFLNSLWITPAAFIGALSVLFITLGITAQNRLCQRTTVVLCGIAIHALAQTALVFLKMICDPENQLPAIEYWIMGTLSHVRLSSSVVSIIICLPVTILLLLCYRQLQLLSVSEEEAKSLGMNVRAIQLLVLSAASLGVAAVISITGLISFLGLIAPHIAKQLIRKHSFSAMLLSGIIGAVLLCFSDVFARLGTQGELPISLFTSILGCPVLIAYAIRKGRTW